MSKKGKARRAAYEARQEEQGKKVVKWIVLACVGLAVAYIVYTFAVI